MTNCVLLTRVVTGSTIFTTLMTSVVGLGRWLSSHLSTPPRTLPLIFRGCDQGFWSSASLARPGPPLKPDHPIPTVPSTSRPPLVTGPRTRVPPTTMPQSGSAHASEDEPDRSP